MNTAGLLERQEPRLPFRCFDTEDVEDLLVDLGVGHFDISGYYHDGLDPNQDFLDFPDVEEEDEN